MKILSNIFKQPYRLLPHAVFVFAALCWMVHPNGAIRSGYLADSDDYMRLNETINWLQGQGWHDLSHPRLSPGAHTVVHWARLLDLPLAFVMLPFIKLMGMQNAALLASFIVPPATFGLLLWLGTELAAIFVGRERANLSSLLLLFAPFTIMNFVPGRVDHHGYEILVAGFALLCLERMSEDERYGRRFAVMAAVTLACGLWIGAEALPWAILFTFCLAVMAAWRGGEILRNAVLFGGSFFLAALIILPLAVPQAEYRDLALSWYSAAYVVFAGLIALMFGGAFILNKILKNKKHHRLGIMAGLGIVASFLFLAIVPQALQGPFADYDDFDSTVALDAIGEAQPIVNNLHFNMYNSTQNMTSVLSALQTITLPILGLIALGFAMRRAPQRKKLFLLAYAVFLAASIVLALFCQVRVGWFMQFFAVAPLTYVLVASWKKIATHFAGRARFAMEIGALLLLGFVPTVLIPALAHDAPITSDVILFPAARPGPGCSVQAASTYLSVPWGYGDKQHTIMASGNEGPELLFRTPHKVIAANFNVAGNVDAYNFFRSRDDKEAQKILKHWNADLVLICRSFPSAYARLEHPRVGKTAFLDTNKDGNLHLVSDPARLTLMERLANGPIPSWLKPVEIPNDTNYLLFEVISP